MMLSRCSLPVGSARLRGCRGVRSFTSVSHATRQGLRKGLCRAAGPEFPGDTIDDNVLKAASDPATSALAQQIIEAEAELKAFFEPAPGKPQPKARDVAKKRQAITDMKELLAAKLNGQDVLVNPDASDDEAERARQLFLEVERSLQRQQRPEYQQEGEYSFELALLEAENERLRETAEALLHRQQQLEDLAEKHGIITFKDGVLTWVEPSERAKVAAAARKQPDGAYVDQLERALTNMH